MFDSATKSYDFNKSLNRITTIDLNECEQKLFYTNTFTIKTVVFMHILFLIKDHFG